MSQNIQSSFDETIKDSNLENLAVNLAEVTIDNLINEGVLRDIPIISTLIGMARTGANIHDKLFLKKIVYFLNNLKDTTIENRKIMIEQIDNSLNYRIKVGEKLLYIIDACNDYENSELAAHLFKAFIDEKITYGEFLDSSNVVTKITSQDFQWFLQNGQKYMQIEDIGGLLGSGLFNLYYEPIDVKVDKETDHDILSMSGIEYKTDVYGGAMHVSVSRIGEIILEIFAPNHTKKARIKL